MAGAHPLGRAHRAPVRGGGLPDQCGHGDRIGLSSADRGAEGAQRVGQRDGGVAGDLALLAVLVIGLQELGVLLLDLLPGLARRAE